MTQTESREADAVESLVAAVADEFMERVRRGETPAVEDYARAHPDIADVLRQVLPALAILGSDGLAEDGDEPPVKGRALGDFRLIRQVGRGGMGIVYEAEQISLGRRVALKVLPLAGTLDPRRLQRFKSEAQAAAHLQHQNIVPVYFVGCDRGVHYYAMQFIDGQSLAEIIDELRKERGDAPEAAGSRIPRSAPAETARASVTPGSDLSRPAYFAWVARLGEQAALALEHAHQLGVLHRDIKPANLMLDGRGNLWVTDFGLAQLPGDQRLTLSGDLVGTLRYMSPEQALAQRGLVDQRTDVYSLGVTLYELLTLEPALTGQDRQELLRKIAFDEPTPPRRLDRTIPVELETIVQKALAKTPSERYATAQEMAEDLRHWLEDRPIRARRPSLARRARKWARRHRSIVATTVALFAVALLLAGAATWWWTQRRALAEGQVQSAIRDALRLGQEEKWPEALETVHRAQAVIATIRVTPELQQQVQELKLDLETAQRLQEARLLGTGTKEDVFDVRRIWDGYAQSFWDYGVDVEKLDAKASQRIRDSFIRAQLLAALEHWASLEHDKGRRSKLMALARMADADADPGRRRLDDAIEANDGKRLKKIIHSLIGTNIESGTAVAIAELAHRNGADDAVVPVLRELQQQRPGDFWINHELGFCLYGSHPRQWVEIIRYWTAAVALRPQSPGAHLNLGMALKEHGQVDEAVTQFQTAIRLQPDFAAAYNDLGAALMLQKQAAPALAAFRQAVLLDRDTSGYHRNLADALLGEDKLDAAILEWREAIRLKPGDAAAYNGLGTTLWKEHRLSEAANVFRQCLAHDPDLALAHKNLAVVLREEGKIEPAIAEYRTAIRLDKNDPGAHLGLAGLLCSQSRLEPAVDEFRTGFQLGEGRAADYHNYGLALGRLGRPNEAAAAFRQAIHLNKELVESYLGLGMALEDLHRTADAVSTYRAAIRLKGDCVLAYCQLGDLLLSMGRFQDALDTIRRGHELSAGDPRLHARTTQQLHQADAQVRLDKRLIDCLAGRDRPKDTAERLRLAWLCQQPYKALYAASARWYTEAFRREPRLAGDMRVRHRYNAACAAALASCGQGKDANKLSTADRDRWRQQALTWLRADLNAYQRLLHQDEGRASSLIAQRLQQWFEDGDLACVRASNALAHLPAGERGEWQRLWRDVEELRQRAARPSPAASTASGQNKGSAAKSTTGK